MDLYNYIAIEGNIGSGKTSLCSLISRQYNTKLILERFEENPFLPKFYEDKNRYAFQVEMSFLADRYKQLFNELKFDIQLNEKIISDYIISKSLIFAKITLGSDEFELFERLFHIIHNSINKPDLLVYLYLSKEQLLKNIKKRNREYEIKIELDYLDQIHSGYFEYFKELKNQRIVVLNTSELDFVSNHNDYLKVTEILNTKFEVGVTRIDKL